MELIHADKTGKDAWCGYKWLPDEQRSTLWGAATCLPCLQAGQASMSSNMPQFFQELIDRLRARQTQAPDVEASLWD